MHCISFLIIHTEILTQAAYEASEFGQFPNTTFYSRCSKTARFSTMLLGSLTKYFLIVSLVDVMSSWTLVGSVLGLLEEAFDPRCLH